MIEAAAIRSFALCNGLNDEQVAVLSSSAAEEHHAQGAIVFEESSVSADFYVVLEGRVCVEIQSPAHNSGGEERLQLAVLREGDVFGEIAFLEGKRRSARICALDDVRVVRFARAAFAQRF